MLSNIKYISILYELINNKINNLEYEWNRIYTILSNFDLFTFIFFFFFKVTYFTKY